MGDPVPRGESDSPRNAAAPPVAGTKEEALSLVRRLPCTMTGVVMARKRAKFPRPHVRPFRRHFVEIRGGALLLYPVGETLAVKLEACKASYGGKDASDATTGSPTSVKTDNPEVQQELAKMAAEDILVLTLKETELRVRERNLTVRCRQPGECHVEMRFKSMEEWKTWNDVIVASRSQRTVGLSDFEILSAVGKGASGKVFLVRDKITQEQLALKVIDKTTVYENNDTFRHAVDERLVMELACDHPFILNLRYAFQTSSRLYLVTEFCAGGDLFDFLRKRGRPLAERQARRVAAEILSAIQYVHSLGVIYRDLKLENVLLDGRGHVRVADFGLSKLISEIEERYCVGAKTFCGTREYVAPEMLAGNEYGQSVDLWACGILLYELLCGRTPFFAANREEVYEKIENAPLRFPRHLSSEVVSLIRGLLDRNPGTRLGSGPNGADDIREHPFFASVDWEALNRREDHPDNLLVNPYVRKDEDLPDGDDLSFVIEEERSLRSSGRKDVWSLLGVTSKEMSITGYSFTTQHENSRTASPITSFTSEKPNVAPFSIDGEADQPTTSAGSPPSSLASLLRPLSRRAEDCTERT